MPSRSTEEYEELGADAITTVLTEQLAAPWIELQARIADQRHPSAPTHIDPHHLINARRGLLDSGRIQESTASTRGGREVTLYRLVQRRKATATDKAAARKRLLMARYLGWSSGTAAQQGITGPTAERVVHRSLLQTGSFQLAQPDGAEVRTFLGVRLGGALDNAAFHNPLVDGVPDRAVAIPIEVKNLREWIYPWSQELYQLLSKAAELTRRKPSVPLVPVLVCRRAHYTTFLMAKDLGFFIVDTRRQYISAVDDEKLREVRTELALLDLVPHMRNGDVQADEKIMRMMTGTFSKTARDRAQQWAVTAGDAHVRGSFGDLVRSRRLPHRLRRLEVLRDLCDRLGIRESSW